VSEQVMRVCRRMTVKEGMVIGRKACREGG